MSSKIVIGNIDLSFHKVSAAVFQRVLQEWGFDVETQSAAHEQMFQMHRAGEVDLLISAWLPGSHEKYLSPYEDQVMKFSTIYEPYCVWAVPDYVPEDMVAQVEDLKKPEVQARMVKTIEGINPGAGISRFSLEMLEQYGLSPLGYNFNNNDFFEFTKLVEHNYSQQNWFVIPLWHPQFLFNTVGLRVIDEPLGLLRGRDLATPILLKKSQNLFTQEQLSKLKNIKLNNDIVSYLDLLYCKKDYTAIQAAEEWMKKDFGSVSDYIDSL